MSGQPSDGHDSAEQTYREAKASKFHFKSRSRKRHKSDTQDERGESSSRHRHSDRKRRHRTRNDSSDPSKYKTSTRSGEYYDPDRRPRESVWDDLDPENDSGAVDSETKFRESLFDALADDEGAAYWEGVYGQPVHVYSDTKPGPDGKLERMTEEEYASFVRTKMWEKSHQHIVEEREAREEARRKEKERKRRMEDLEEEVLERETIQRRMEESLRRGKERRKAKDAEAAWDKYVEKWDTLKNTPSIAQDSESNVRNLIPWPVASGQAKDVSPAAIELFLRTRHKDEEALLAILKVERVRWHPDKMQQRFGQHIDPGTMKTVTAVFQVLDKLWNAGKS